MEERKMESQFPITDAVENNLDLKKLKANLKERVDAQPNPHA